LPSFKAWNDLINGKAGQQEPLNKTDIQVEKIPAALPVIEVGLKGSKCAQVVRGLVLTNATAGTIYTTPTDQDFYLTFASLTFKTATTGLMTQITLKVVINTLSQNILGAVNFAATGTTGPTAVFNCGNHPIKIDRGTTIEILMDAANDKDRAYGTINGYLDEVA